MGKVAMESTTLGRSRGYPIIEATLYVYCDSCGSFDIKKHITLGRWLMVIFISCLVALAVDADSSWLMCLIPVGLMILPMWRDILLSYKCRQCGNKDISDHNALCYPSYDKSVVDVPERRVQKRYIDEDTIGFGRFT